MSTKPIYNYGLQRDAGKVSYPENLRDHDLAILEFVTPWSKPCQDADPIIEDVAERYGSRLMFYQIDKAKNEMLARVFGVMTVPTILF